MPPRRRRKPNEEGIVDVWVVPPDHAAEPGRGFDLGNMPLSYAELKDLAFDAFGVNQKQPDAWHRLRFAMLRQARKKMRRGPKAAETTFWVICSMAGVTDDDAPSAAAKKIMKFRRKKAGQEGIERQVRRYRKILAAKQEKLHSKN